MKLFTMLPANITFSILRLSHSALKSRYTKRTVKQVNRDFRIIFQYNSLEFGGKFCKDVVEWEREPNKKCQQIAIFIKSGNKLRS